MWSSHMDQQIVSAGIPVIIIKYWLHTMHLYGALLIRRFFKVKDHYARVLWEETQMERRLAFPGSPACKDTLEFWSGIWRYFWPLLKADQRGNERSRRSDEVNSKIAQWGIFFNEQGLIGLDHWILSELTVARLLAFLICLHHPSSSSQWKRKSAFACFHAWGLKPLPIFCICENAQIKWKSEQVFVFLYEGFHTPAV